MSDMVSMVIRLDFHARYRSVNTPFALPEFEWLTFTNLRLHYVC